MNILELKGLKKYFSSQKAVDDISLTVAKGQIFGLLGPNGAGKTTLIRMITGIFYPDEGEIILDGKKFDPINDTAYIGYMPEERGLYKKMKIGEQALYLAELKGLSRSEATTRIKKWFVRLGMESWWNKKVEDLSKGMQQKLQFVITVLHEPKLIILDEPFSGLDPVNSNLIKDEIFRLAQEGATIIFSTHRMEQVEEICNHIVLVNQGKKILDGTVKGVKQDFKENLFRIGTDRVPSSLNVTTAAGEKINYQYDLINAPFEVVHTGEEMFVVRIKENSKPNDVLQYLMNQGATIHSFNEILPSLNEIFIKLVEATPVSREFQQVTA